MLKKINVLAEELVFPSGAKLVLDSRQAAAHRDYVKPVLKDGKVVEAEYEVVTPATFGRGDTLWIDEKFLPKLSSDKPEYRIVNMPRGYRAAA